VPTNVLPTAHATRKDPTPPLLLHHVSDTAPVTVLHHFDQFSCRFLLNSRSLSVWGCCDRRTQPKCPQTCCLRPTQRGKTPHHHHRYTMFLTLPPSLCFIISTNSLVVSCLTVAHHPCGAAVVVAPCPFAPKNVLPTARATRKDLPPPPPTPPPPPLSVSDRFASPF